MAIYRCKACLAIYQSPQRDGVSYFHSCAPLPNAAYWAQYIVGPKGEIAPKGPMDPAILEMTERPNKRDENIEVKPGGKVGPKADGAGKDTLP